jgi:hypothetical protein
MARQKGGGADINSAFDLFLDTVSNAFGGIVFILLLVIVLLQLTGPGDQASVDPLEARRKDDTIKSLELEIIKLENTIDELEADLKVKQAKLDPALFDKYRKLKAEEADLQAKLAEAEAAKDMTDPHQLELKIQETQKVVAMLGKELEEARVAAASLKNAHSKNGGSAASATTRQQVPLFLYGGRLVSMMEYDERGHEGGIDSSSVLNMTKSIPDDKRAEGVQYFLPKKGKGMVVSPTPEFIAQLNGVLRKFKPENHYIGLVVWPDSFAEFEIVRNKIYDSGFGYYVVIMAKDEPVPTGGPAEEIRAK